MQIHEYKEQVQRTCPRMINLEDTILVNGVTTKRKIRLDALHMVLGLSSELEELEKALTSPSSRMFKDENAEEDEDVVNIGEELTDLLWYACNYATQNKLNLDWDLLHLMCNDSQDELMFDEHSNMIIQCVGILCDIEKKYLAYGKVINSGRQLETTQKLIAHILDFYRVFDIDAKQAMQNNIDKLKVRYPEGWSEDSALNRDIDAERKELEK
jgi:NTP pyrophosphatase (non-canonical NTP hydrolase)